MFTSEVLQSLMYFLEYFSDEAVRGANNVYIKKTKNICLTLNMYLFDGGKWIFLLLDFCNISKVHLSQVHKPRHENTSVLGFQLGLTQISLYKHRRWLLETGNFEFRKRNCAIRVAKTKVLISFAVITKLICTFVFA